MRTRHVSAAALGLVLFAVPAPPAVAAAPSTIQVSRPRDPATSESLRSAVSANGRYVAFTSSGHFAQSTNPLADVYVWDRSTGSTKRVSAPAKGRKLRPRRSFSDFPATSPDGRYISFTSTTTGLMPFDTVTSHVYLRDMVAKTTTLVDVTPAGAPGNGTGRYEGAFGLPSPVSADGRYVAFLSWSSDLVPGDTNGNVDAFVRDLQNGTTRRVDVANGGTQAASGSYQLAMTPDASVVAFASNSRLSPDDANDVGDIYVRDLSAGTTTLVSRSTAGASADDYSQAPSLSADGRLVAFLTYATNLVPGDTNGAYDVLVRDRQLGTTKLVSAARSGGASDADSSSPQLSADGRWVAFVSGADDLAPGDTNESPDIYVRDLMGGVTSRASVTTAGAQTSSGYANQSPTISADGRYVTFTAGAPLVPTDTNDNEDVYLRDRGP